MCMVPVMGPAGLATHGLHTQPFFPTPGMYAGRGLAVVGVSSSRFCSPRSTTRMHAQLGGGGLIARKAGVCSPALLGLDVAGMASAFSMTKVCDGYEKALDMVACALISCLLPSSLKAMFWEHTCLTF